MSPTLSGSLALYHIKLGDALELCNGIIFDFYSGLPHLCMQRCLVVTFSEVLHKHCLPEAMLHKFYVKLIPVSLDPIQKIGPKVGMGALL